MTMPPTLGSTGASSEQTDRAGMSTLTIPAATVNAHVLVGAPCRRRSLWVAVVRDCPFCANIHVHRSGAARLFAGEAERVCPQTGRSYLLVVGGGCG